MNKNKTIKGVKGFDKNLKCRDFQYEIGETFTMEDKPKCCNKGFHFCEYPLDVFNYYVPTDNRFCEVESLGDVDKDNNNDSKIATNKIKIGAELSFQNLAKASIDFIYERVKKTKCKGSNLKSNQSVATNTGYQSVATNTGYQSVATNTGDYSVATNTGYQSVATNTGDYSVATNTGYQSVATNTGYQSVATNTGNKSVATNTGDYSVATNTGDYSVATNTGYQSVATNTGNKSVATNTGDYSVATNTGDYSVATNTGDYSVATNTGYQSVATNTGDYSVATNTGYQSVATNTGTKGIASSLGIESKAKGSIGTWLVLAEWVDTADKGNYEVKEVKSIKVDGEIIKENTLYQLVNGEFVEVEDESDI